MRPNYTKALKRSIEVLKKYNVNKVPIDIIQIVNQTPNLKIQSYSDFAKKYGCSIEEIIEILQTDLGAISRRPKTNKYVIYYNDTKYNQGLDRFTIAHEMGHYFLNHFKLISEDILNRGGFTPGQYDAIEKEANCFARNLLTPVPLYNKIPEDPLAFEGSVMETFDISYEASIARGTFLKLDNYRITKDHIKYFDTYEMPYFDCCDKCKNPEIGNSIFCNICGNYLQEEEDYYFRVTYIKERNDYMIYNGIEVDENSKAKVCPECLNEEPELGDFCSICSKKIVNRCTNVDHHWRNEEDGPPCGELLAGNARYCTHCGFESSFLQDGILSSWKKSLENNDVEIGKHHEVEPFHAVDELPF